MPSSNEDRSWFRVFSYREMPMQEDNFVNEYNYYTCGMASGMLSMIVVLPLLEKQLTHGVMMHDAL